MRGILEKTFCFARKMAKRESESSEQVSTKDTRLAVSVILEKVCCSLEASCSNHSFNTEGYFQGWEYWEVWFTVLGAEMSLKASSARSDISMVACCHEVEGSKGGIPNTAWLLKRV